MQAMNDRAAEGGPPERRQRRSPYLAMPFGSSSTRAAKTRG